MKDTITSILQIYRRPQYLQEQLKAIESQTIKSDKIIIVHNEGNEKFDLPEFSDKVQYIYANPNLKFHLRYAIALLVDTEYVAFFDDDTIPQEKWFENCISIIQKVNCICVSNGRIVYREQRKQEGIGWGRPFDKPILVDFGGHSLFMKRTTLKYMWYEEPINLENGEDLMLSINAKRFAGIPTIVPPHPLSDRSLWGSDPDKAMEYGSDSVASWIVNKEHNKERYDLFDAYHEKGWNTVLEEKR